MCDPLRGPTNAVDECGAVRQDALDAARADDGIERLDPRHERRVALDASAEIESGLHQRASSRENSCEIVPHSATMKASAIAKLSIANTTCSTS